MAETQTVKTLVVTFDVSRVFPSNDPLAIDLLRLMCGCSDIFHVEKWIFSENREKSKELAESAIRTGRVMLQFRLIASFLCESLKVLRDLTKRPRFAELRALLSRNGIRELERLQAIVIDGIGYSSQNWNVDEVIRRARNAASFHYDTKETEEALKRWPASGYKQGKEGDFVVEFNDQDQAWPYYAFADLIRAEACFGFKNENYDKNLRDLSEIVSVLKGLVQNLFFAYIEQNNLGAFVQRSGPSQNID
jgi:hypothetical protein